jgi:hypothetical protein
MFIEKFYGCGHSTERQYAADAKHDHENVNQINLLINVLISLFLRSRDKNRGLNIQRVISIIASIVRLVDAVDLVLLLQFIVEVCVISTFSKRLFIL